MLLASLALIVYVKLFEHRLIYFPEREVTARPSVAHEDVRFEAADGTLLHGWFLPRDSGPALIVSHGNGGNIGHRAWFAEFLADTFEASVFMYDYRGYGESAGRPSEAGTYADIRGAYAEVRSRGYAPEAIFLFGQSLGTAVTVDLAAAVEVGGVVLEAPFASVPAMARHLFHIPLGWLIRTRYDSLSKISGVRAPVALVHAREDPIVPFEQGVALYEAATNPKAFFVVDGPLHEGSVAGLGVERLGELRAFLMKANREGPDGGEPALPQ